MPTVENLIDAAKNNKPVEFGKIFTDLVSPKMADAISGKKMEVAQSLFGKKTS